MVLFLEDLSDAVPGDALTRADEAEVAAVLRAAATVHGTFSERAGSLDLEPAFVMDPAAATERGRRDLRRFLARYGDRIPSGARGVFEALVFDSGRLFTDPLPDASTLVHADLHLDNVFLRDGAAILLDWQSFGRGPGPLEAARFLALALRSSDRPVADRRLFSGYTEALAAAGGPRLDEATRERWRVRGLLQAVWQTAVWMGSADPFRYSGREGAFVTQLVDDPTVLELLEAEGGADLLERL